MPRGRGSMSEKEVELNKDPGPSAEVKLQRIADHILSNSVRLERIERLLNRIWREVVPTSESDVNVYRTRDG